jgi:hypothetical protein
MAKIIGEVALVAGAVALDVFAPEVGVFLTDMLPMMVSGAQVGAMAMSIGLMGAGMLASSIASAIQGGGVSAAQSVHNPAGSRKTIVGQTRTNGTKIYESNYTYASWGINQVIAWASHPCQQVSYVYLDGREVYFTGQGHNAVAGAQGFCDENTHYDPANNPYNFRAGSNYHVYVESSLGSYAGYLIRGLNSGAFPPSGDTVFIADPSWTANCTLNGICASQIAAASSATMFANPPMVKAAVMGKNNIYDPRGIQANSPYNPTPGVFISPTLAGGAVNPACCQWTANAALHIADFLINTDYGFGYLWTEIDTAQLIAAANICDQQVPLATPVGVWLANHNYTPGQIVMDTNGRQQQCAGYYNNGSQTATSSGAESDFTWATGPGQATVDHQIQWLSGIMGSATSEAQYQINGEFEWATAPGDTLAAMLESCAGRISIWNGMVKIFAGAWQGVSGISYDLDDIVDKISFKQLKSRDQCNAVRAKYICPNYPYAISGYDPHHKDMNIWDGQYQPTDAPPYAQDYLHGYGTIDSPFQGDVNLQADGGVRVYQDKSYQFVQSVGQAQRLMKIYLLRKRFDWSGTIRVKAKGLQNVPNDVITLTLPQYGWLNKLFEITELRHIPKIEDNKPPVMYWEFDLQETDSSIYTWSTAEERGMTNTNSPTLTDSLLVADPTGLTLESGIDSAVIGADGVVTPRINANWTEPLDPFVTSGGSITVQFQLCDTSTWQTAGTVAGDVTQFYITGVVAGDNYNVRIQAAHASGASGNWVEVGPYIVSDTLSSITSSGIAPNVPYNQNNNCWVQPTLVAGSPVVNIFAVPGSPGWPWTQFMGTGTSIIPAGQITGLAFSTVYWVVWNTQTSSYLALTNYNSTLNDVYLLAGTVTTPSAGGTGGVSGGGGFTNHNGARY